MMIEHNIGVSTERVIKLKRIDSDYFEEQRRRGKAGWRLLKSG